MHDHDDRGGEELVPPSGAPSEAPRSRRTRGSAGRRRLTLGQELLVLTGLALLLAVVVKSLFLQAFYIPSGSMNDTLVLDDRILVQKVSYWGGAPQRGDVVVFRDPGGWLTDEGPRARNAVGGALEALGLFPAGGHLVKRVVAVGGDTVGCCDDAGRLTVNGVPLEEEGYLPEGEEPSLVPFEQEVREGHLWVMGDNRSQSADSRAHLGDPGGGMVPEEDVVGKVFAVVWPLDNATMLTRPETYEAVGP